MSTDLYDETGKELTIEEVFAKLPIDKITRIEVVDDAGRAYTNWYKTNKISLSIQDESRTLKVFITRK